MSERKEVPYFLGLSIIGAMFVLAMSFLPSTPDNVQSSSRLLVGIFLALSFLLGISLALRPSWFLRLVGRGERQRSFSGSSNSGRRFQGHHPDCNGFNGHVVEIYGRKVCTGCLGLALGASVSILLTISYVAFQWIVIPNEPGDLVILGLLLVALNLMETSARDSSIVFHIVSNALLMIGFCFVVIGVLQKSGSAVNGFLAIIISFLWLDTRIRISNWKHSNICIRCPEKCKVFSPTP